jgi:hypothetical protein
MADYTRYCRGITHPYPSQEGIFRPYNFVCYVTNPTVDPEDPFLSIFFSWSNFSVFTELSPDLKLYLQIAIENLY